MLKIIHTFVPYIITFTNHIFLFLMKKQLLRTMLMALCGGAVALTACVDKDYDLTNLDTTMKVGSGTLMLPTSSTEDIQLNNLFSLADDGPIKEIKDTYYLDKGGSSNPKPIHIDEIKIKRPESQNFSASIVLDFGGETKKKVSGKAPLSPLDFEYIYNVTDKAYTELKNAEGDNISEDVVSIKSIGFDQNTVKLQVSMGGDNYKIFKQIHFDGLSLTMPKGFRVSSCTYKANGAPREVLSTEELRNKAKLTGVIDIFEGKDEVGYNPNVENDPIIITLTFEGADVFEGSGIKFFNGSQRKPTTVKGLAQLSGEIRLNGFARLTNADIDEQAILTAVIAIGDPSLIPTDGNYKKALKTLLPSLSFNGSTSFDKDFVISTFSGDLQHEIDNPGTIAMENLPDFLTEDDVCLDLSNPQLFLKLYTDLPAVVKTSAKLVATSKKNNRKVEVLTGDIVFDGLRAIKPDGTPRDTLLHILAKDISSISYPDEYAHLTYRVPVATENLGDLLQTVPDEIEIKGLEKNGKLLVQLPDCKDISVKKDYKVSFEYLAYCPLSFGEKFQIVYRSDEVDMNLGDDLDKIDIGGIVIESSVLSSIPLDLILNATPIDKDGNIIENLIIEKSVKADSKYNKVNELTIRAKADGKQDADNIRLAIRAKEGSINDYVKSTAKKQLDGIKLEARLRSPQTSTPEALKANSYIKLTNVRIGVDGGVTIIDK